MKNLRSIVLLAAVAAFLVLPLSFEFTGAMLFVAGLITLLVGEYAAPRKLRTLPLAATPAATTRGVSTLRLAA